MQIPAGQLNNLQCKNTFRKMSVSGLGT